MIEPGKIFLPLRLDYKNSNGKITFRYPEYMTREYIEDSECILQLQFYGTQVHIDYYCEDEIVLSDLLNLPEPYIAYGDLNQEKFAFIQSRALKVLKRYLDDPLQELMEYFDNL